MSSLRSQIASLRPGMSDQEISRIQQEMLLSIDAITAPPAESPRTGDGAHARLSRRENEVMSMMLQGQRLKEIASRLDISVKTVTTHRSRLMKKLSVEDNLGLYRYGIRAGLISV